jgi:hypothetical protein
MGLLRHAPPPLTPGFRTAASDDGPDAPFIHMRAIMSENERRIHRHSRDPFLFRPIRFRDVDDRATES